MPNFRTPLAFLIAPLVIPVGLSLAAVVFPGDSPVSLTDFLGLTVLFALYSLPVAYAVELVLGVPAWFVFRRYGIRSWWAFAAGGVLLGMIYDLADEVARYVAAHAFPFIRT